MQEHFSAGQRRANLTVALRRHATGTDATPLFVAT
jgi:hypothetical protein